MNLTDEEKRMRDGDQGPAVARAMDLLIRYGEALGAERFVPVSNAMGTMGAATPFMRDFARKHGGMEAVFAEFNLDSPVPVEIPRFRASMSHNQQGIDPSFPTEFGVGEEVIRIFRQGEAWASARGVQMINTCTPYQVGNVPVKGEHLAWMESSAVIYANGVLGARTNTEGRESASSSGLTGRTPWWGLHLPENRVGTDLVTLDVPVETTADWGMLGYWLGEIVQERIPVIEGVGASPNLQRLKHFGAAAASSGGVEMFHVVGVTPEAATREMAFGSASRPVRELRYGVAERRATWEQLNATAQDRKVDYVMLGCPHYSIEQMAELAALLEGRRVHPDTALWIFTPRAIKALSDHNGFSRIIEEAGGKIMSDTCSAMSRAIPPGTRVAAFDSAKQVHYLPAIMGIQGWFGSTAQCVDAAVTGRFDGGPQ